MQKNRAQSLAYIDQDEGPELNVSPDEPGGSSCRGVTMEVLAEYCSAHALPPPTMADMKVMTAAYAGTIFGWCYLDPIRFDELPNGIDYRIADAAISLGVTGACTAAQMAMEMWPITGIMDDGTIESIKSEDTKVLLAALDAAWITWKHGIDYPHGWATYNHGWINRVRQVRERATAMLGAA